MRHVNVLITETVVYTFPVAVEDDATEGDIHRLALEKWLEVEERDEYFNRVEERDVYIGDDDEN